MMPSSRTAPPQTNKPKTQQLCAVPIIIVIFVILLYLFDTQIINVPLYKWFLSFVVGDAIIIKIFYIYFGWLFSER